MVPTRVPTTCTVARVTAAAYLADGPTLAPQRFHMSLHIGPIIRPACPPTRS